MRKQKIYKNFEIQIKEENKKVLICIKLTKHQLYEYFPGIHWICN
jgi:hypothetical protein